MDVGLACVRGLLPHCPERKKRQLTDGCACLFIALRDKRACRDWRFFDDFSLDEPFDLTMRPLLRISPEEIPIKVEAERQSQKKCQRYGKKAI